MPDDVRDRLELLKGGGLQPSGLVSMVRDGPAVVGESEVPGLGRVDFEANAIRRERTGVHAHVAVSFTDQTAAYTVFNVERDEDRTRLANSAGKRIGREWSDAIKVRLDQFCRELWSHWVSAEVSEWAVADKVAPVSHLLYPYVMAEAGTIVFGYKGQGKSWLGILWTMMLQHGISSRWSIARPVNAMFVNLERSRSSVERRRAMVGRMLGVQGMRSFHARGRSLADVREAVGQEISKHGVEVVIVDSLSRAGTGKLTADDDTNRSMDLLNGLGCAWVALAHTAKSDGEHVFGSLMQENAADVIVQMVGCSSAVRNGSIGCRLRITAANDLPRIDPEIYALDFEADALAAIRPAERGEFPDLTLDGSTPADQIAAVLSEEGNASAETLVQVTGLSRSTVYEALKLSRFVRVNQGGGRGNKTVWGLRTVSTFPEDETAGQGA